MNKLLFLFSLRIKSILVASQNWATDVTWIVLSMSLQNILNPTKNETEHAQ